MCGKIGISYNAEPAMKVSTNQKIPSIPSPSHHHAADVTRQALCYCRDCQKTSGSTFSTNCIVPGDDFKVTGNPKAFAKIADSGKTITNYFCGDCGSTLYRDAENLPGMKIIRAGVLDDQDALEAAKPTTELYAPLRPSWQPGMPGVKKMNDMQ